MRTFRILGVLVLSGVLIGSPGALSAKGKKPGGGSKAPSRPNSNPSPKAEVPPPIVKIQKSIKHYQKRIEKTQKEIKSVRKEGRQDIKQVKKYNSKSDNNKGILGKLEKIAKQVAKGVKELQKDINKYKDKIQQEKNKLSDQQKKYKKERERLKREREKRAEEKAKEQHADKNDHAKDDGKESADRDGSLSLVSAGDEPAQEPPADPGPADLEPLPPVNQVGADQPRDPSDLSLTEDDRQRIEDANFSLAENGLTDDAPAGSASAAVLPGVARAAAGEPIGLLASANISGIALGGAPASGRRTGLGESLVPPAGGSALDSGASAKKEVLAAADRGDWGEVLDRAMTALETSPNDPELLTLQGEAYNHLGHYAQAEEASLRAVRLDPGNARALQALGWAQLNLGMRTQNVSKLKDAVMSYTEALKLDPNNAKALLARAMAYEGLGQDELKLADLRKAAELNESYRVHLEKALSGGKLFDPDVKDSYRLLDPMEESGEGSGSEGIPWMALLVLSGAAAVCFGGLLLLWRKVVSRRLTKNNETIAGAESVDSGLLGGKYQMSRIIGKGGMGQIWEARDHSLDRTVAIKQMTMEGFAEVQAREAFKKEAQTLASLNHPNIVNIIEIIDSPNGLYLVFELLNGKTLEQIILEKKRLSLANAKAIMRSAGAALEFAHQNGIIHRDLKPANIMVTQEHHYVKVMDFGIARKAIEVPVPARATLGGPVTMPMMLPGAGHTQSAAGTPMYMAPEAYRGVYSPQVDIYALGIILYEMVTGGLPFAANTGAQRVFVPASKRMMGIPPVFDDLIRRAVDGDPGQRPGSVSEFLKHMEAIAELAIRH